MQQALLRIIACVFAIAFASGCANFEATKAFASQGDKVTGAVNAEFEFLATQCARTDALYARLLGEAPAPAAANPMAKACKGMDDALAELSASTLDLFGQYNQAIAAISDGSKYDLSPSFKSTADRLKALKDKDGPIVSGESVEVALKAANLLADVATVVIRNRDMKRLLNAGADEWPKVLSPLKTFFGPHAGNMAVQPSPYQNSIVALNGTYTAMTAYLRRKTGESGTGCIPAAGRAIECEPIRARELIYEDGLQQRQFVDRLSPDDSKPSKTARSVQDAIDAWLQAHEALRNEAFKPDAEQLWALLQALKNRADELDAAIKARKAKEEKTS